MAKQSGLIRIKGKVGDYVYYSSKVGGALMREQNAGMSERVKTDPAYQNTRLNASEFGGAGKLAGAIISPISSRWRYILDATATGQLAKVIKEGMATDTANPWGQRTLPVAFMPVVQEKYNELSKNDMPTIIVNGINNATLNAVGTEISTDEVSMDADFVNTMLSKGAEGIICQLYSWQVGAPKFNPASGKYEVRSSERAFFLLAVEDVEVAPDSVLIVDREYQVGTRGRGPAPENSADHLGGLCVIMLPYKVVSNEKYILQEHCAAYWHPLTRGV